MWLEAVAFRGVALQLAPPEIRNDRVIALAAVSADGWAYQYVGEDLQRDPEILRRTVGRPEKRKPEKRKPDSEECKNDAGKNDGNEQAAPSKRPRKQHGSEPTSRAARVRAHQPGKCRAAAKKRPRPQPSGTKLAKASGPESRTQRNCAEEKLMKEKRRQALQTFVAGAPAWPHGGFTAQGLLEALPSESRGLFESGRGVLLSAKRVPGLLVKPTGTGKNAERKVLLADAR